MSIPPLRCGWCDRPLPKGKRKFCDEAHRQRYKRAQRAEDVADIVQRLEPYVRPEGEFVFQELVEHLTRRVNERV